MPDDGGLLLTVTVVLCIVWPADRADEIANAHFPPGLDIHQVFAEVARCGLHDLLQRSDPNVVAAHADEVQALHSVNAWANDPANYSAAAAAARTALLQTIADAEACYQRALHTWGSDFSEFCTMAAHTTARLANRPELAYGILKVLPP